MATDGSAGSGARLAIPATNHDQVFSFSGANCSMAAGLPYAIGAQAAFSDRQVVVFTGDGSLTMQLGDVLTAVQHKLPIKIVVVRNDTLGLINWEQMVFLGNPSSGCSSPRWTS